MIIIINIIYMYEQFYNTHPKWLHTYFIMIMYMRIVNSRRTLKVHTHIYTNIIFQVNKWKNVSSAFMYIL